MALESLEDLTRDWERLRRQKSRETGGVEARVMLNVAFALGEQYVSQRKTGIYSEPQEDNKLYLVFNMIGPRLNKLLGRVSATQHQYIVTPDVKDPKAFQEAAIVQKLDKALDQKLSQPSRLWEMFWWMAVGGTAVIHTPWIPDAGVELAPVMGPDGQPLMRATSTEGEEQVIPFSQYKQLVESGQVPAELFEPLEQAQPVGEVGCEVLGPLNFFMDQAIRSIEDMSPDQMCYIAHIKTVGWVEDNFKRKVEPSANMQIVTTPFHQEGQAVSGHNLRDIIPLIQGSRDSDDTKDDDGEVVVITGYGPPATENPEGRMVVFIPHQTVLYDEACPYGEIPLVDLHWKPVTTSFWTADYVSDLIAPQRFINKRMSQLGEQANAAVYSHILGGPGKGPDDVPADYPGFVKDGLNDQGQPLFARLEPPALPTWFLQSNQYVIEMFNDIAGGTDLFRESKFPGQLRGSESVPMLQEILDTEWGPLFFHVGDRMARVKQQRLNRVKKFYPETRTLHYVDASQRDEVFDFHAEETLGEGVNYNISIEPSSLLPELRTLREQRLKNRLDSPLAILYLDERTGQLDKQKIAAEMHFGEPGRETRDDHYRQFSRQIIERLWKLQPLPPVMPFYDHRAMLDELEEVMSTTEFLEADQRIQQVFNERYEQHRTYLVQEAEQQAESQQQGAIQNAVAQATQQAAAQAASMAIESAMGQAAAQQAQPTGEIVQDALSQTQAQRVIR